MASELTLQDQFSSKNQKQLDAIESIRADLTTEGISVPGVVVVGAQSAGKSSVLESLSGIQLPRGATITTRVPLFLRLENNPALPEGEIKAFICTRGDMEGREEISLEEIASKVRDMTISLAGGGGSVRDNPIHLKIQRNGSPNLTLVDLPGLAYSSADENLDGDIYEMTKGLIVKYSSQEEMIIVAVTPATEDFANQEALKFARTADPEGLRTLGVATKTDRIEDGPDFQSKIRADGVGHIKLKLGYVAVRNRTQKEVDEGISLDAARVLERQLFETDPRMKGLAEKYWGMGTVIKKIVEVQSYKIREFIPKIRQMVNEKVRSLEENISALPPSYRDNQARRAFFIVFVQKLVITFENLAAAKEIPIEEEIAVAAKSFERYKSFSEKLEQAIPDFLADDYQRKLEDKIRLTRGGTLSNFLSHPIFAECVKQDFIKPLEEKTRDLIEDTDCYVKRVFATLLELEGEGTDRPFLPKMKLVSVQLRKVLLDEITEFICKREKACIEHLVVRTQAEAFVFTLDPLYGQTIEELKSGSQDDHSHWNVIKFFSGVSNAFVQMFREGDNEKKAICEMQTSLKAYVKIRHRGAADDVSKILHHFFIKSVCDDLSEHLYACIPDDKLEEIMAEDPTTANERACLEASLSRFKRSKETLKNI